MKGEPMSTQASPQMRFADRPEVSETFADAIRAIGFDGQTMRFEFCVTRMEHTQPPNPPSGCQYPACRLVLTPNAAIDLFNKLQRIMGALEQSGAIKRNTPTAQTVQ
jgi:hypothetical protein